MSDALNPLPTVEKDACPLVQGACPCCGSRSLFLGAGGYVTCGWVECSAPDAATLMLEQRRVTSPGGSDA